METMFNITCTKCGAIGAPVTDYSINDEELLLGVEYCKVGFLVCNQCGNKTLGYILNGKTDVMQREYQQAKLAVATAINNKEMTQEGMKALLDNEAEIKERYTLEQNRLRELYIKTIGDNKNEKE